MKASLLLPAIGLLMLTLSASAQDDTARHRAAYEKINAAEASLRKVTATCEGDDGKFALTGWLDDGVVKKIVAKNEDGDVDEFYLEKEEPLFVFSVYQKAGGDGEKGARIEERLYFKDGEIFKWLTSEKPAPVFHAEDYQATTGLLANHCAGFVAELKKGKPAAEAAPAGPMEEGIFTGIEEGDYAHWNMKTRDGVRSFFVLKTNAALDKVIANPKTYIGRRCRVTWKKSTEEIPEAGGKQAIEQILAVEWLEKP